MRGDAFPPKRGTMRSGGGSGFRRIFEQIGLLGDTSFSCHASWRRTRCFAFQALPCGSQKGRRASPANHSDYLVPARIETRYAHFP